jgi:hypothetical protein
MCMLRLCGSEGDTGSPGLSLTSSKGAHDVVMTL